MDTHIEQLSYVLVNNSVSLPGVDNNVVLHPKVVDDNPRLSQDQPNSEDIRYWVTSRKDLRTNVRRFCRQICPCRDAGYRKPKCGQPPKVFEGCLPRVPPIPN